MEVRVKRYRIQKMGRRGASISIPQAYLEDLGLKPGDELDAFRNDSDRLIFAPVEREERSSVEEHDPAEVM